MKIIQKAMAFFLLLLCICIMPTLLFLYFCPAPVYPSQNPDIKFEQTTRRIAEGKRIAQTICVRCHYNEETGTLSGRHHSNPQKLGIFYSGNITNDSLTGIGKWTNGQIYYFLKTGIKPDGSYVFDMAKYINLNDDDLYSIISFLRSNDSLVRPTNLFNPAPEYSLITKTLLYTLIRPPVYIDERIQTPDTSDKIKWGRYLATAKYSCFACHSGNMVFTDFNTPEKSWRYFQGSNPHVNNDGEEIYSANLTPDNETGIGKWTETDFIKTVKNGIKPDGSAVRDPMFPFYLLTDNEIRAIFAYLKSLKPVYRKTKTNNN